MAKQSFSLLSWFFAVGVCNGFTATSFGQEIQLCSRKGWIYHLFISNLSNIIIFFLFIIIPTGLKNHLFSPDSTSLWQIRPTDNTAVLLFSIWPKQDVKFSISLTLINHQKGLNKISTFGKFNCRILSTFHWNLSLSQEDFKVKS